jgi:hypothetical protein
VKASNWKGRNDSLASLTLAHSKTVVGFLIGKPIVIVVRRGVSRRGVPRRGVSRRGVPRRGVSRRGVPRRHH